MNANHIILKPINSQKNIYMLKLKKKYRQAYANIKHVQQQAGEAKGLDLYLKGLQS